MFETDGTEIGRCRDRCIEISLRVLVGLRILTGRVSL